MLAGDTLAAKGPAVAMLMEREDVEVAKARA